jgi:hypothetical protein
MRQASFSHALTTCGIAGCCCLLPCSTCCSADVLAAIASHKQRLFGRAAQQPGFGFVGLHLRLGGMANEEALKEARGSKLGVMADLISGLRCSRQLGAAAVELSLHVYQLLRATKA